MKMQLYVVIAIAMTQPTGLSPAELCQLLFVIALDLLLERESHIFGKTVAIMGTI